MHFADHARHEVNPTSTARALDLLPQVVAEFIVESSTGIPTCAGIISGLNGLHFFDGQANRAGD